MKILLSGSTGMLGREILTQASLEKIKVTALDYTSLFTLPENELIKNISRFDVVIHAAANTNVERCESDIDDCYRDNYLITEVLARAAQKANVVLVFISSTGVYGAKKQIPYKEYDQAFPTTHHHMSKFLAEQCVMQLSAKNLVVRTGWLFGGARENPKNFVARRIDEARDLECSTKVIFSNMNQRGVPCYVADIASRILVLIKKKSTGIFNCVNEGNASRFEYVKAIVELASINIMIKPISSGEFNRKANVSDNEMADNWKMYNLGFSKMPHWRDSLSTYIEQLISKGLD